MAKVDLDGHLGLLVRPPRARWVYVLAHGAGAGMRHAFLEEIAGALATAGVATLRWEFPYMAAGRARRATPDPPAIAHAAVRAVWSAARERLGDLPMFAGGKSFGGRMTSGAHAEEPLAGLAGIAFLGFPLHPPDRPGVERAEHLARTAPTPLLFVQGTRDLLAPLPRLSPVIARLGRRARLHAVAHADHGFDVLVRSGRTHAEVIEEIAGAVAAWMARIAPDGSSARIAPDGSSARIAPAGSSARRSGTVRRKVGRR